MLLNRYVDIAEAIESQDASLIDNTEYHDTGTYPAPIALLLNSLNALKTILTSRYHYHLSITLVISYILLDAIPLDANLPTSQYIRRDADREDVKTYVLSVVTDSNIEQRFPDKSQSRGSLYEGLFNSERPTCIVTGFPVHPADLMEVNNR